VPEEEGHRTACPVSETADRTVGARAEVKFRILGEEESKGGKLVQKVRVHRSIITTAQNILVMISRQPIATHGKRVARSLEKGLI